jgi:hypothetical protein
VTKVYYKPFCRIVANAAGEEVEMRREWDF